VGLLCVALIPEHTDSSAAYPPPVGGAVCLFSLEYQYAHHYAIFSLVDVRNQQHIFLVIADLRRAPASHGQGTRDGVSRDVCTDLFYYRIGGMVAELPPMVRCSHCTRQEEWSSTRKIVLFIYIFFGSGRFTRPGMLVLSLWHFARKLVRSLRQSH
jgi:hypothetical protein